jgi:membrane-associated phospholipid phosphatase
LTDGLLDTSTQISTAPSPTAPSPTAPAAWLGLAPLGLGLWGWCLIAGIVLGVALHPFDAPVDRLLSSAAIGGDIRREWSALQQYGQFSTIVIVSALIWLLDPARRARLFDYWLALGLLKLATQGLKMLIGRPRPKFGDPDTFLGPLGLYPVADKSGLKVLTHAWDPSSPAGSQLWSMPSSHSAFAVAMSLFLVALYPRLAWVALPMALIVMGGRLIFDAHWLTDTLVGACLAGAAVIPVLKARPISRRFASAA